MASSQPRESVTFAVPDKPIVTVLDQEDIWARLPNDLRKLRWEELLSYQFAEWNPHNPRHPAFPLPQSMLVKSLLHVDYYYWIFCANPKRSSQGLGISAMNGYTLKHEP
ncbi:hypothetical protein LZ554_001881 [Drepanopeziza brunnea f. sp. 'monogermtubi']|nr:hypothetical protein LZ554_001881 [Drepanopeziza brunnea f. sp. 'monogermtubi']